jgi:hypothetical protein
MRRSLVTDVARARASDPVDPALPKVDAMPPQ